MSQRLCVSPEAEARLACAAEFLTSLPPRGPALLLVPSLPAASELLARVLRPGEARFSWRKRTLGQLARELALPALARTGRVPLSGLSLEALVARVLHELAREGGMTRHAQLLERPGFARALSRTLDELRMAGVDAQQLRAVDGELGRVLAAYEARLDELALADRAHVFALAREAAATAEPLLALDVPLVHHCEAQLAQALTRGRADVCVTVARGDDRSELHWRAGLGAHVALRRELPKGEHDLARLQRGLFAPRVEQGAPEGERRVRIVSSPGEAREAVEIARGLIEAAARGVPFDRMAVLLRASEGYRAVVEEALSRAEVPAHFADGVRRPLSSGRAFMALLSCAREGLSARAFAEYLSLGEYPRSDEVATPRRWERMLVDAAVIGGLDRWRKRIDGLIRELTDEAALVEERDELALKIAQLEGLKAFALPMLALLEPLKELRATWGEWLDRLRPLAEAALRTHEHVLAVLSELAPLAPIGPVGLGEVTRVLAPRLSSFVLPSKGLGAGKVFVGTIDDVRGRAFDVVFVPGLAERVFPQRIAEDPLLPDAQRAELGADLWLAEERVAGERLLLRIAVGAAREQLVLSFPRFDIAHGRPRVPSFYGLEVLQAIDGSLPAFDELTRRADPGAAARMGFPAPEDATRAIDDAEYDLAVLGRLSRAGGDQTGALRYLLQANTHLSRALRFRARRWSMSKFNQADGFVAGDDAGRALLAEHKLAARSYSASALSQFAACPYRFYLQSIARIAERPEVFAIDELDARQRGVLFHRVQRATLSALRAQHLLPLTLEGLPRGRAILAETFAALAQEAREQYAPSIDGVFETGLRAIERDLSDWLQRMLEEHAFVPRYFELAFGLTRSKERDEHSVDHAVPLPIGMTLRGSIDLVEMNGAGELRATDFKTSRVPENLGVLDGGRTLQPLLYGLALEQLFPDRKVSSGRLYYCTSRGDYQSHEVAIDATTRRLGENLVAAIEHMIAQGFLPAVPAPLAEDRERYECERCAYRAVCGPHEPERAYVAKLKDRERLDPLFNLRRMR